jgi:hypothetical protein
MRAAISCGKTIIANTTTTAAQSKTRPTNLPRTAHCFARYCCQNPKPKSKTDRPKSQGRRVVAKALAAPALKSADYTEHCNIVTGVKVSVLTSILLKL